MNPHLVITSALFAPFSRFLRKLHGRPVVGNQQVEPPSRKPAVSGGNLQLPLRRAGTTAAVKPGTYCQRQPLRVVRVMEAGQTSTLTGRILMSGRMADVCAELDRMVERETAFRSAA